MNDKILAWYAYSESGAARPAIASETADGKFAGLIDLDEAAHVAALFGDARQLDAHVDADGWRHLFSHYDLDELIDLARAASWPRETSDETIAEALFCESLDAGYDPVSGLIGTFERTARPHDAETNRSVDGKLEMKPQWPFCRPRPAQLSQHDA